MKNLKHSKGTWMPSDKIYQPCSTTMFFYFVKYSSILRRRRNRTPLPCHLECTLPPKSDCLKTASVEAELDSDCPSPINELPHVCEDDQLYTLQGNRILVSQTQCTCTLTGLACLSRSSAYTVNFPRSYVACYHSLQILH